ncbi:hypothetical protein D917_05888 [Trichinella nativa]|uniref:Uncharacterized protein n=1 Tax=Trichinella nativa TaxID=6335 RepID=A0A1Y3EUQ9_9BILA|nr:hypothetical protein D917_05888 [Trichinella nativa]
MNNASNVRSSLVNGRMKHIAGFIDAKSCCSRIYNSSGHVDLHQRACRDFVVKQAERIDQHCVGFKFIFWFCFTHADVIVNALVPLEEINQSVQTSQLVSQDALLLGIFCRFRAT